MRQIGAALAGLMCIVSHELRAQIGDERRPASRRRETPEVAAMVAKADTLRICASDGVCRDSVTTHTSTVRTTESEPETPKADVLNLAQMSLNKGVPTASVQALKYQLGVSDDKSIPFVILVALPALTDTSTKAVSQRLLDEYGGLLNLSFVHQPAAIHPWGLFRFENPLLGMFYEVRMGTKFVEGDGTGASLSRLKGLATALGSLRLALPIWADRSRTQRAGSLSALLTWTTNYSYSGDFAVAEPGTRVFTHLNAAASLNLTDVLSVAGGATLAASAKNLEKRTFVSFGVRKN